MAREGRWNGLALRLHRVKAGLSVAELARKLREEGWEINPSSITRWEAYPTYVSARQPQDDEMVRSLARVLGCSVMAFYRTPILTYDRDEPD